MFRSKFPTLLFVEQRRNFSVVPPWRMTSYKAEDVSSFTTLLSKFGASENSFQLVKSFIRPQLNSSGNVKPQISSSSLLVLDSSFNPPTKAHLNMALSSLTLPADTGSAGPLHLLLLLATQNCDKSPQPASFEHRLQMMSLFASDIFSSLPEDFNYSIVDIGLTKHGRFLEKSRTLRAFYPQVKEQIYLTGYDTLIRILDPKYYAPEFNLSGLGEFFSENKIRCTYRHGVDYGGKEEQMEYLENIKNGSRENHGCRIEWADKIELVENSIEIPVSSTQAREAIRTGRTEALDEFLTEEVKNWVISEKPYNQH